MFMTGGVSSWTISWLNIVIFPVENFTPCLIWYSITSSLVLVSKALYSKKPEDKSPLREPFFGNVSNDNVTGTSLI